MPVMTRAPAYTLFQQDLPRSSKCCSRRKEDVDVKELLCTEVLDCAVDEPCSLDDSVFSCPDSDVVAHVGFADDVYIATLTLDNGATVDIGQRIGEGTFGSVHLGLMTPSEDEDATLTVCAVKVVNITHPLDRRQSLDEVHVFKTLSGHERFPEFIAARKSFSPILGMHHDLIVISRETEEFTNATGEYLFIVMEYVEGRSLDECLEEKPVPEDLLRRIAKQLLEGLVCMQSFGRVHRDIKPQNIVLDTDNNVKIIDFGLSIYESEDDAYVGSLPTVMCSGTPAFLAPEILYTYRYTPYSDIWALGATLLYMLVGPWYLQLGELSDLDDHERNWQLMEELTKSLEGDMGDFVRKALTRKCEKRPLAAELLGHSWLADCDDLLDSD